MEEDSVYRPPVSPLGDDVVLPGSWGPVSSGMVEHLVRTKPWVRLISVIMFILSAFMLIASVGIMAAGSAIPGMARGQGLLIGAVYLVVALVYIYPAVLLFRYASAVQRMMVSRDLAHMEAALGMQRSFWRLVGILTLAMIVLYAVVIVVMVGVGIATGLGR